MLAKFISLFLVLCAAAGATTLTGTLKNPDGNGANGTMYFSLSQPAAVSAAGGCGGPIEVVPTRETPLVFVNGAMQSSLSLYGNDCLLPQGTYYNVRLVDAQGNILSTDRWVLAGSTVDIGTIVSVIVSGTTATLGSAGVVLTNPTGNQTITQPGSTALSINSFVITDNFTAGGMATCKVSDGQCKFQVAVAFLAGLGMSPSASSDIFAGPAGNMYTRAFTGSDAFCSGITDGWFGVRLDLPRLEACLGGSMFYVPLVPASGVSFVTQSPAGNQTITQPTGTTLAVNDFTVTAKYTGPGQFCQVSTLSCNFTYATAFLNGIGMDPASHSYIYIGTLGNFFNRTYTGASPTCSMVQDGWMAIKADASPPQIEICIGGARYKLASVADP